VSAEINRLIERIDELETRLAFTDELAGTLSREVLDQGQLLRLTRIELEQLRRVLAPMFGADSAAPERQ